MMNLAANGHELFWVCSDETGNLLCGTSLRGDNVQRVLTSLPDGAASTSTPAQLVADDSNVYVVSSNGSCAGSSLEKVPVAGGAPVTLVSGFDTVSELATPHALVIDDTYVYWSTAGQLLRTPK